MIIVSVMYPPGEAFDEGYYFDHHLPLVHSRWGGLLTDLRVLKGMASGTGGEPAYQIMAELSFSSKATLDQALKGPHAAEVMADIPNFTRAKPAMQISEVIG